MHRDVVATFGQVVDLVFVDNVNDARIDLVVPTLRDATDLFTYLVDLLMKGLVRMYGGPDRRLDVEGLGVREFEAACRKLANAGVECRVAASVTDADARPGVWFAGGPGPRVEDHALVIWTSRTTYTLRFGLHHARPSD